MAITMSRNHHEGTQLQPAMRTQITTAVNHPWSQLTLRSVELRICPRCLFIHLI